MSLSSIFLKTNLASPNLTSEIILHAQIVFYLMPIRIYNKIVQVKLIGDVINIVTLNLGPLFQHQGAYLTEIVWFR